MTIEVAKSPVCIVTGSNKGIGLAVVRELCRIFPSGHVYLTSRNLESGQNAVETLRNEGFSPNYHRLDINDDESIAAFHDFIKNNHDGIDILVNNAGIAYKNDSSAPFAEQAEVTVKTNFDGTRRVCNKLFLLLKSGCRVVNVSSNCGHLSKINGAEPAAQTLRSKLSSDTLTEQELVKLMADFVTAAKKGEHFKEGWPNGSYKVSKVGLSALTRVQQKMLDECRFEEDIVVNNVHPGFIATDMSSYKGPKSVEDGAKPIIFAATLPPKTTIKGAYIWEDSTVTSWVEENVSLVY